MLTNHQVAVSSHARHADPPAGLAIAHEAAFPQLQEPPASPGERWLRVVVLQRRQAQMNLDELRVIERITERLELGRLRYGELDLRQPRPWRRELREELLDALIYDAAEELNAEDQAHARVQPAAIIGLDVPQSLGTLTPVDPEPYETIQIGPEVV